MTDNTKFMIKMTITHSFFLAIGILTGYFTWGVKNGI